MVENDTSSVEYQLSTSTGPFSIPFYFIENGHIVAELYTQNGDDFNKTTLTIDVDYYLNGAGDKNGGQLTLLSAHSGATLLIYRDPDATQLTSYLATGKFPATSHERALDKLTMLIQKFGWWWDSLALKKPNIFANYYDALNNRIRNLRDPSLAQDAATKSYVDSSDIDLQQQITSNFNRSLRVPDSYISQLPSAQDRAWKGLGFDGAGQPKLQDPAGTGLWGYVPAIGSFEQGSLLTQRFEVLLWESTDEYWRWDGVMPKVVLPGSTPATAGGTGKGKWIDVTDATLRSNLGSGEEGMGDALLAVKQSYTGAVARTQHDKNWECLSILDFVFSSDLVGDYIDYGLVLNRAITALEELGSSTTEHIPRRAIYFPAGEYYFLTKVTLGYGPFSIIGEGIWQTLFKIHPDATSDSDYMFDFTSNGWSSTGRVRISELYLANFSILAQTSPVILKKVFKFVGVGWDFAVENVQIWAPPLSSFDLYDTMDGVFNQVRINSGGSSLSTTSREGANKFLI